MASKDKWVATLVNQEGKPIFTADISGASTHYDAQRQFYDLLIKKGKIPDVLSFTDLIKFIHLKNAHDRRLKDKTSIEKALKQLG